MCQRSPRAPVHEHAGDQGAADRPDEGEHAAPVELPGEQAEQPLGWFRDAALFFVVLCPPRMALSRGERAITRRAE
jgi:hypothetical protein